MKEEKVIFESNEGKKKKMYMSEMQVRTVKREEGKVDLNVRNERKNREEYQR